MDFKDETTEELLSHHPSQAHSLKNPSHKNYTILILSIIAVAVVILGIIISLVWYFFIFNKPLRNQLSGVWYTKNDSYGEERILYFDSDSSYVEAVKDGNSVDEFYCDYSLVGNRVDSKLTRYTVNGTEQRTNDVIGDDLPMDVAVKNGKLIESVEDYLKNNYMQQYIKNETISFDKLDISYEEALKKYFGYSGAGGGKV